MISIGDKVLGAAKVCWLHSQLKFQLCENAGKDIIFVFIQVHGPPEFKGLGPWVQVKKSCLNQMIWLSVESLVTVAGQHRLFLHK